MRLPPLVAALLCVGAVCLVAALGLLRPVDDAIADLRFDALDRAPTGNIVFVEIDGKSLQQVGVWPWPRRVEAKLLDRLMALGADDVVFDVDFSSASDPADDALFAAALDRAGGYAALAAFSQTTSPAGGFNFPLPAFAKYAQVVAVEVPVTASGMVRTYGAAAELNGRSYPTAGAALAAQPALDPNAEFGLDFGIDLTRIDRISAADLLDETVAPARIAGRKVVIGASASELRDLFVTPRFGIVPGGLLHILAAETIVQHRQLTDPGLLPIAGLLLVLAGLAALLRGRLARPRYLAATLALAILFELAALALQGGANLILHTASLHLALVVLVGRSFLLEMADRRCEEARAAHERDAMRATLDRVIADNFDGILVINEQGDIVAASRFAEDMLGDALVGRPAAAVLPADLAQQFGEALGRAALAGRDGALSGVTEITGAGSGQLIEYAFTVSTVADLDGSPKPVGCVTFRDITARHEAEARLLYLARHDPLTGAWTRETLIEHLAELARAGTASTLLLIDLKRFNAINETLGHGSGDNVLRDAVSRLRGCGIEAVARLGGDSFAVVLPRVLDAAAIEETCGRIFERLCQPYDVGEHRALVGACIGVTNSAISSPDPRLMLSNADTAHSLAKLVTGNAFVVFERAMGEHLVQKRELELALRHAVTREELTLAYQPQVLFATEALVGAEALVRWRRADGVQVSPAEFIPVAEETGLIVDLGKWVLNTACREATNWPAEVKLAVNVSPVQFELTDMVETIRDALHRSGLPPSRLDIEITEGLFVSKSQRIDAMLNGIRELGVGVALDDFGTGYSSLGYISRLPVDKIKIDQYFVRGLPADRQAATVVRAVMMLAESLGKTVVVEGVETVGQAALLRRLKCHIAQGYLFGRPMPASDFLQLCSTKMRSRASG